MLVRFTTAKECTPNAKDLERNINTDAVVSVEPVNLFGKFGLEVTVSGLGKDGQPHTVTYWWYLEHHRDDAFKKLSAVMGGLLRL